MAEYYYETGELQSATSDTRAEYSFEEQQHYARRTEGYGGRHHDRQRSISPSMTLSPSRDYPRRTRSRSRSRSRNRDYDRDRSRSNERYRHHRSRRDHYSRHDDHSGHHLDAQEFEDRPRRSRHRHRRGSNEYTPSEQLRVYGIPPDMTADELKYILEQMGAILESANLSHNRDHDPSIGVAFAQFVSVGAAQEFMEKHGRDIVIGNYTASLRYWRSSRREDWECQQCHLINFHHRRECYMCGIPRRAFKQPLTLLNDGTRDIGTTLHNTLLIRNLDPLCDEEHVYGSVLMATDKVTTPLRVLLVRDRTTQRSCSYAFVEFADIMAATKAVSLLCDAILYPTGFQIYDRPVAVSYAHPDVFQAAEQAEYCVQRLPYHHNMSTWMMYWDQQAYLTAYPSSLPELPIASTATTTTTTDGAERKASLDDELNAFYDNLAETPAITTEVTRAKRLAAFANPTSTGKSMAIRLSSQSLSIIEKAPIKATNNPEAISTESASITGTSNASAATTITKEKMENKIKNATTSNNGKKVVKQIQKWTERQEELKQMAIEPETNISHFSSVNMQPVKERKIPLSDDPHDYGDPNQLACLLCQRKFKSIDILQKHQEKSELHISNLKNSILVEEAQLRKSKLQAQIASDNITYRDRAAERREIYGQPERPPPHELEGQWSRKSRKDKSRRSNLERPERPTEHGIGADNIGNRLLKSMGWQEGTGLGRDNTGIVEPIQAEQYAQNAGIGASHIMAVDPSASYTERVRALARQRLEDEP